MVTYDRGRTMAQFPGASSPCRVSLMVVRFFVLSRVAPPRRVAQVLAVVPWILPSAPRHGAPSGFSSPRNVSGFSPGPGPASGFSPALGAPPAFAPGPGPASGFPPALGPSLPPPTGRLRLLLAAGAYPGHLRNWCDALSAYPPSVACGAALATPVTHRSSRRPRARLPSLQPPSCRHPWLRGLHDAAGRLQRPLGQPPLRVWARRDERTTCWIAVPGGPMRSGPAPTTDR